MRIGQATSQRSRKPALRFDLYGHGLSDRPHGAYSLERFSRQTCELIEATEFLRPAALLGHSLGAAIAAAVAAANPQWIDRLVLVAPMLDFNATSAWSRLFRVALVGELLMRLVGVPALVRRRRRYARIGLPHLTPESPSPRDRGRGTQPAADARAGRRGRAVRRTTGRAHGA